MFQCENNILLNFKACYTPADLHKWRFVVLFITKLVRSLKNRASYISILSFYFLTKLMQKCFKVLGGLKMKGERRQHSRVSWRKCAQFPYKCLTQLSECMQLEASGRETHN